MRAAEVSHRLGARVTALRQHRGMSQDQLADRVGITPQFLADIEGGPRGATLEMLTAIAEALGVTVSDLVTGVDAWSPEVSA